MEPPDKKPLARGSEPRILDTMLRGYLWYNLVQECCPARVMYPWTTTERDPSNPDPEIRERAINYLQEYVDIAVHLGAPLILVAPSSVAKSSPVGRFDTEEAWMEAAGREWSYPARLKRSGWRLSLLWPRYGH
jgi:sugar phosphate isomerase/epimerase